MCAFARPEPWCERRRGARAGQSRRAHLGAGALAGKAGSPCRGKPQGISSRESCPQATPAVIPLPLLFPQDPCSGP